LPRQVKDWITEYVKMVSTASEGTENYHFWSAATIVGASMKRHVWVDRKTYRLYPNQYVILIGRPGIGKGSALNPAMAILKIAKTGHFMSGRLTIEYVLEELGKGFGGVIPSASGNGVSITIENALLLFSPEFNVFASASQFTFKILTDLWDCPAGDWDYGTRRSGKYVVRDPCISVLAGCTPDALVDLLPSAAISAGFTRRVNFVYTKDNGKLIPWPDAVDLADQGLVKDLQTISLLRGEYKWSPEAKQRFTEYYIKTRTVKDFQDEAEASYDTTRWAHATKLAMVLAASKGDSLVISEEDFVTATQRIDECANTLKNVFRAVGDSDMAGVTDRVVRYLEIKHRASRAEILRDNWRHMSSQVLDIVMSTLIGCNMVDEITSGHQSLYQLRNRP
jgi:hypothetical protein